MYFSVPAISQKQIQDIVRKCAKKVVTQSAECFRHEFQQIVRTKNLKVIMDSIVASDAKDPSAILDSGLDCHGLSHIIGETAGSLRDARASTLISACGSSCGYGCTHGVVMGMMKYDPNRINNLETLCKNSNGMPLSVFDQIACFHGLGHGLAEYTRYDASAAVARCNTFGTGDAREECMTGVFMEVYAPADKNHASIPLPQNLFSDCEGLRDTSLLYCKRMMIVSLYRVNHEIVTPIRLCHEEVSEKEGDCIHTLGADAYFVEHEQIDKILGLCRLSGPLYANCIEGVVSSSITIHQDDRQAKEICFAAGEAVSEQCEAYAKHRLQALGSTRR